MISYTIKRKEKKKVKRKKEEREVIVKSRVSVNLLILVKSMFAEMIGLHEQIRLGILLNGCALKFYYHTRVK
jgi:hypothetical protein